MTDPDPSAPTRVYAEIEATLSDTAQGRDFLVEHARRSRQADTRALLDAIARLETHLGMGQPVGDVERLRSDLADMSDVIRRAKADLAGTAPSEGGPAAPTAGSLDWIAAETERATSDILDATEQVQEAAWTMREGGFDPDTCDRLDRHATVIYAACTSQDMTAQRIGRLVSALAVLEERIGVIGRVWEAPPTASGANPPLDDNQNVLSNDDIDFVLVAPDQAVGPMAEPENGPEGREAALAELRRLAELGTRDKLRLFT